MTITSYIIGFSFVDMMGRKSGFECCHEVSYVFAGIGLLTVYAELFSLVYKVGLLANAILLLVSLVLAVLNRKALSDRLKILFLKKNAIKIILAVCFAVLFAYGTSTGFMHYDSDLYHAQSIRWIEEYGVVKGLGNIHTRLAYNSASFCLSALFSMSFLGGQSFHVCAGYLACMTAVLCVDLFKKTDRFAPKLSNMTRVVTIYYLMIIFDEMVSPASDYFMVLLVLSLLIMFFEHLEAGDTNPTSYALLSLLAVVIMSIKISGALIVLVCIYPAYLLIKSRQFNEVLKYVLCGVLAISPFLVRNVWLSGYLIYPVTAIDLFNPIYKIPKGIAEYDSREIRVYGRGYTDVGAFNLKIREWLPAWFEGLDKINKVSFVLALAALVAFAVSICIVLWKKKYEELPFMLVIAVSDVSFVYWLLTSPNIRYGCVFLWLAATLCFTWIYRKLTLHIDNTMVYRVVVGLFLAYKLFAFSREAFIEFSKQHLISQQDYGTYEYAEKKIKDITFYYPLEGDQIGYNPFPSFPYEPNATLIGDTIAEGFMPIN